MMAKFISRKFLLALLIIVGAGLMNVLGIEPDPTLAELVKWVAGLYFAGNVAQKATAKPLEKSP